MSKSKIKVKTVFETEDGETHKTQQLAEKHQARCDLESFFMKHTVHGELLLEDLMNEVLGEHTGSKKTAADFLQLLEKAKA